MRAERPGGLAGEQGRSSLDPREVAMIESPPSQQREVRRGFEVKSVTRRELLRLTGAVGGGLALGGVAAACAPTAAPAAASPVGTPAAGGSAARPAPTRRPRETITIGTFGGPQEPAFREHVQKPLEQEQNAEVVVVLGNGGSRRPKVIAEKGKPSMDVIGQSLADVHEFVTNGIVMPSNPKIPHFDEVESWATERAYCFGAFGVGIRYNPTKVDKPTSYADVWNPKYKGHVAIPSLPRNATGPVMFYMISKMEGGDVRNTENAWKKFAELKPNVVLQYASVNDMDSLWKQQDIWIAIDVSFSAWQFQYQQKGECAFVAPKEGMALMGNCAAITVGTQHQALAELAVGYFLSEPFQKAYAESNYFIPTRKSIQLKPEIQSLLPKKSDLITIPTLDVALKIPEWSDRWNRTMVG